MNLKTRYKTNPEMPTLGMLGPKSLVSQKNTSFMFFTHKRAINDSIIFTGKHSANFIGLKLHKNKNLTEGYINHAKVPNTSPVIT